MVSSTSSHAPANVSLKNFTDVLKIAVFTAFVSNLKKETGINFEKHMSLFSDPPIMLLIFSHRYLPVILMNVHDSFISLECLIAYSIISFSQYHLPFFTAFSLLPLN